MKSILHPFLSFLCAATLGLALTLIACPNNNAFAEPMVVDSSQAPIIKRFLGDVKVYRKRSFVDVTNGMKLEKGDSIRTGRRGRVYIDFPDNSRVKLGNQARFEVHDWSQKDGIFSSTLRVFQGAFRYTAGLISQGFGKRRTTVSTRTAVLGVRGTDFWGRAESNNTFFLLIEGEVLLAPQSGEHIVYNNAGHAVNVSPSHISEPQAMTMDSIAPLAAETEITDEL